MLPLCAQVFLMHVQWMRVEETMGVKGLSASLSIPNLLLHAKGGV